MSEVDELLSKNFFFRTIIIFSKNQISKTIKMSYKTLGLNDLVEEFLIEKFKS